MQVVSVAAGMQECNFLAESFWLCCRGFDALVPVQVHGTYGEGVCLCSAVTVGAVWYSSGHAVCAGPRGVVGQSG